MEFEFSRGIQRVCPLLLPVDLHGRCYAGFVTVAGKDYYLRLTLPQDNTIKNSQRLECDLHMSNALRGLEQAVEKRLSQSKDLPSFLIELVALLEQSQRVRPVCPSPPPPVFYSALLTDIQTIGWERVVDIDLNFTMLKLKTVDKGSREHILSLHFLENYPMSPPHCEATLPSPFLPSWSPNGSLQDLISQFEKEIDRYQPFWQTMNEIDVSCWVLEPQFPSYACKQRRIVIDTALSIHVTVDPNNPNHIPKHTLLGPDQVVSKLRDKLYSYEEEDWNFSLSLLANLQSGLDLIFPCPSTSTSNEVDHHLECGICYVERSECGHAPDVVCGNTHCMKAYHHDCLLEWLHSLGASSINPRLSTFNAPMVSGECPYCSEMITVKSARS